VVDVFATGDNFDVFDFGNLVGKTTTVFTDVPADCGDDPLVCLATVGMSKGFFNLAAGNHSLTLVASTSTGLGTGYLRVAADAGVVPEPTSVALVLAALGAAIGAPLRKHSVRSARSGRQQRTARSQAVQPSSSTQTGSAA
jgi:hypothetical protein